MTSQVDIDRIIEESQHLREELLRAASRLEAFADQLVTQVELLRGAAQDQEGVQDDARSKRGSSGDDSPGAGRSGQQA